MKKPILFLIIFIIIITILSDCQYFTLLSQKEWTEMSGNEDNVIIYVAGAYQDRFGNGIPCYWKIKDDNIKRVDLDNESNNNNYASSIYVVGDKVYTSGTVELSGGVLKACYWIDTKRYNLNTSGSVNSFADSIIVKGGVVFAAGGDGTKGCYWIDQNQAILNLLICRTLFIQKISSSKYTTYVGGQNLKSPHQACFWKDGYLTDLPPLPGAGESSIVNSIFVIGNIVYSVGEASLMPGPVNYAYLWKNDEPIILPNGNSARSVFVSNDDIYISGDNDSGQACYWKNEKYISLSSLASVAYSIYVYNNKAYIAGYENGYACYWINDKHYSIENSTVSIVYGIFVKSDNEK